MRRFRRELARRSGPTEDRRWLYVPYDQLSHRIGPLAEVDPREAGIVLVESPWKAARRPYHRQKLALVLANQRQFALEQASRGVAVRYEVHDGPYSGALRSLTAELGTLEMMEPAERELRADLASLVADGRLRVRPHAGWLSTPEQFREAAGGEPPWRMDAFYRRLRQATGLLMEDGRPIGGKYSFDAENRRRWPGEPPPPEPPRFRPDAITREVGELVEERFARHPGELDLTALPATASDARRLWSWALRHCLEHFGPYEDAMSTASAGLFHTRISPLLNLHRLLPRQVVDDVATADAPLASREGFIRQVLGWREFVRHVHRETDGFRLLPHGRPAVRELPGDGGWGRWSGEAWLAAASADGSEGAGGDPDGGASPSHLGARAALPPAFWGVPSGLACLDTVVADVWRAGWSHHITRLMVLANIATLLDVRPRELTDWFWAAYVDAYDWVVEPNVLGMGSFALGELMTTKPYVSGAAYLHRMSDYCRACPFDPDDDCPLRRLYWAFLGRHADRLAGNPRLNMPLASLRRRSAAERRRDARTLESVRRLLRRGRPLTPETLA